MMARKPKIKELTNTRLLKEYASWVYCEGCNRTVAYLCYVTYDFFDFEYTCGCQNHGHVHIEFDCDKQVAESAAALVAKNNRWCCPNDDSPLVSIVNKNLTDYKFSISCEKCGTTYTQTNSSVVGLNEQ